MVGHTDVPQARAHTNAGYGPDAGRDQLIAAQVYGGSAACVEPSLVRDRRRRGRSPLGRRNRCGERSACGRIAAAHDQADSGVALLTARCQAAAWDLPNA
jgi:hypothetical protein